MILTHHWSATSPARIRDYHVEYALTGEISASLHAALLAASGPADVSWGALRAAFQVWKNVDLATPTDYGTWHLNHDPRDQSANVEIGALCMGGEGVGMTSWGAWPFTIAHAWMAVGIGARICKIKNIDPLGSFDAASHGMQNGPLSVISTHGERALQTPDPPAILRPSFGYFAYSGDPDCRWDISALDVSKAAPLASPDAARSSAIAAALWIRTQTNTLFKGAIISDLWGLDKPAT